jgi:PhnB protein
MRLNAHLSFSGNCEEAFRFYADCLGGTLAFQITYANSPMAANVPEDWHGKLLHARLDVGTDIITGADSFHADPRPANGFTMAIHYNDGAQVERVFNALAAGGAITLPLQKMFWTSHFGMLTDRFGVPWMINFSETA